MMKKLIMILSLTCFSFVLADSAEGNWKLSGLRVDYYDISRAPVQVAVQDAYGMGVSVVVSDIPAGALFNHTPNGPFNDAALQFAGVNLNVNLYPDGSGVIGEGSYYPDVDLIPGTCITQGLIYPITDAFSWTTNEEAITFPEINIIGQPTYNAFAGQPAYGLGVNGSSVFDNWGATPTAIPIPYVLPAIADAAGNVYAVSCGAACVTPDDAFGGYSATDAMFGGDAGACVAACSDPTSPYFTLGMGAGWLPGAWGGYYRQGELGASQMGDSPDVQFLLEWSAIDGWESESGLGDELDVDEDGDGTEYDRIFGIPYITATYINNTNPLCDITGGALAGGPGFTLPVAGDIVAELGGEAGVSALVSGGCYAGVASGAYDNCIGQVYDGVYAQCDAAGGPVPAVTGLCYEASQTEDFAGACAYYGAAGALTATCLQLGFSEEVCSEAATQAMPAVEAYCIYATGVDCATAGINECDVLTNPDFSLGLCGTLAGALTTSETCTEWVDSFYDYDEDESSPTYGDIIGESFFDANAASVLGVTCTEFSDGLNAGLAAGDPATIATIDGLFESVAGMSCSDLGAGYVDMCVEEVGAANDFYLMDLSLEPWGFFLTYNAASVQLYQSYGYSMETIMAYFPELFVNDSGYDFDPSCYYTGEPCGGKIHMIFNPTCVPEVEAHTIVAEFVDLQALDCEGTGDVAGGFDDLNGDGVWDEEFEGPAGDGIVNVVDVVKLVGHVLGNSPLGGFLLCEADINGDGIINVVDIVGMVNIILSNGRAYQEDATEATIEYSNSNINIEADGYIGGIDLTVEFASESFEFELGDHFVADWTVNGNTAHIVMVSDKTIENVLNVTSGQIVSISNVIAANSNEEVSTTLNENLPEDYSIKAAYPNPFNPSTTLELALNINADVSVKVFNITGQLVDVIAEGNFVSGNYSWNWNAENLASGTYFITTQIGNEISQQKVTLIK